MTMALSPPMAPTLRTGWNSRLQSAVVVVLLLVSLWTPPEGAGAVFEYARYGMFCLFGTSLIIWAYVETGRGARPLALTGSAALLVSFFVFVSISALWSESQPGATIKAGLVLLVVVTALAIVTLKSTETIARLVLISVAVMTIIGALVAIAIPSIGVETGWLLEGKWRGVAGQKNGFAAQAGISLVGVALLYWGRPDSAGRRKFLWPSLFMLFFGFCLLMGGSRGAQVMCLVGLLSIGVLQLPRSLRLFAAIALAIVVVPFVPAILTTVSVDGTELAFLGLTFDTSSRTMIWTYGLEAMGGRELLGFGVGGFWTPERMLFFKNEHGWVLDNFHNGYITILVENGILGLGLLLVAFLAISIEMWGRTPTSSRAHLFATAFFFMFLAENLIENVVGRSTDFLLFTFLILTFSALRSNRSRQAQI